MPARPPLKTAHQHATKVLVQKHNDEWQALVNEYLDSKGWAQVEVTSKKWQKAEPASQDASTQEKNSE